MERTLAKKITINLFFILGYFYRFFYFICNFFSSHITLFSIPKELLHIVRNEIKENHDNWLKNNKVIQSQKLPKKLKIFSLKIHKGAGIFKKPQNLPK